MKILVTGATGFTGKRVLPYLKEKASLRLFARRGSDLSSAHSSGCEIFTGNLDYSSDLESALEGCEGLIDIAPMTIGHTEKLLAAAEKKGVSRALFVGSTRIFTRFPSASKTLHLEAEQRIRKSRLRWTILRPTMIYGGEGDRTLTRLIHFLKKSPIVPVPGSGATLYQPVWVEDLARAIVNAFFNEGTIGKSYNLSGPHPISINEMIDLACQKLKLKRYKIHLPLPLLRLLTRLYGTLASHPVVRGEQILRLAEDKNCDCLEAMRDLHFIPKSYADVLDTYRTEE